MTLAYVLGSVLLVSLVSFVGAWTLFVRQERLKSGVLYVVSFSAGAMLGDAFLHLLPEAAEAAGGVTARLSLYVIAGFVATFVLEKAIHWYQHAVVGAHRRRTAPFAWTILAGDFVHNLVDGMIIAGSYVMSVRLGVATTLAVVLHEVPQELGDFGVLLHAGFSRARALFMNFLSALGAVVGALLALGAGSLVADLAGALVPFAVGNFVYVAGSDLIPELRRTTDARRSLLQIAALLLGIAVMVALLWME